MRLGGGGIAHKLLDCACPVGELHPLDPPDGTRGAYDYRCVGCGSIVDLSPEPGEANAP